MSLSSMAQSGFTGNALKIIAMIAMTCDHVGLQLLPDVWLLRAIGRLALPIYAYMIAEGCRHTRNRARYFGRIAALAAVCQVVYFFAMGSVYQCILVTFCLSMGLIFAVENVSKKRTVPAALLALAVLGGSLFLCELLPALIPHTDFAIDYGFVGVLLPVLVYFSSEKTKALTGGLFLLALRYGGIQWLALAAVPLLGMYNGKKGDGKLGMLFYLYYPLHLVVIYGISLLI